jgi:Tfp pilus assembly protein PilX
MKTFSPPSRRARGYALVITMFFTGLAALVLAGAMQWTSNTARLTDRNNQYYETMYAAEAATEKVVGRIMYDFRQGDQSSVYNNLAEYRALVPEADEDPYWSNFVFGDATGANGQISVSNSAAWGYSALESQYRGLYGLAATYQVTANARYRASRHNLTAAVAQTVQVATIPVFQFAIFYGMDMEISCGQPFNVTGRVHSNGQLYVCPDNVLTFFTDVTAVGDIRFGRAPGDSRAAPSGSATYRGESDAKVGSLTLPIGTNNSPTAVRAILEPPPSGEDVNSAMGKQRYYNKADLVVKVYDQRFTNSLISTNITYTSNKVGKVWTVASTNIAYSTNLSYYTNLFITGKSGLYNNFTINVPSNQLTSFVSVTNRFMDNREGKTVESVDINVGVLRTNTALTATLGRPVNMLYVEDARKWTVLTNSELSAVRMVNGQTLPTNGLTVATARPMYIKGHYNAPAAALGTTNTANTVPASVVADAITILSGSWTDANSFNAVASRVASATTVNTAILSGIVPTTNFMTYSGGAENFPRFLEDWNPSAGKQTFTYNGSMVVMFPSQYATHPWGMSNVYDPPARNWAFDVNFMDARRLPPGTPSLSTLIRGQWALAAPRRPN